MDTTIFLVLLMVGFVLFMSIGIIILHYSHRREDKLKLLAKELNMGFAAEDPYSKTLKLIEHFEYCDTTKPIDITNIISGTVEHVEVRVFDYHSDYDHANNSIVNRRTVLLLFSPLFQFPPFTLKPEGFLTKAGTLFGETDINFKDFPVFSAKYNLKSTHEYNIRELFTPEWLRFFEAHLGWYVEAKGDTILIVTGKKSPAAVKRFLSEGLHFIRLIKP
jgi:hypothetical protein